MIRRHLVTIAGLSFAIILTSIGVIHTKYMTRIHFAQLQDLRAKRDASDVEWNRLRLEEAALSTHGRVERKARHELGMFPPRVGDVLLIEDTGHGHP
ncbi:cell division protein FtsL [Thiocystis violacea]|uniref:cell division protein FtsL n=1 Tax=Thiocystis violacea TaxID=13725 RepID=UPI0019068367|nr:cell division protein FtsL [Thiocystis violacea]MBK1716477.1 cell division protein FtsL [Thiocystis violacea]